METKNIKQLALQKAISSHEQAAAGLADLMGEQPDDRYMTMLSRIKQNIVELQMDAGNSKPGDVV